MEEPRKATVTSQGPEHREPTLGELVDAISRHVGANGSLRAGVAAEIAAETGWSGRILDVLAVLTEDEARMGYLTGGQRPEEVLSWLPLWVDSPFSVEEIRLIVTSAGWDPEPFVVVAKNGLLERLVHRPDGSLRRILGELAGGWLSDRFALAGDEEILREVRKVLKEDLGTATSS